MAARVVRRRRPGGASIMDDNSEYFDFGRPSPPRRSALPGGKRWMTHAAHESVSRPLSVSWSLSRKHRRSGGALAMPRSDRPSDQLVVLDGSYGEGGGQILRTALTLSLLTGRPFRLTKIRSNRDKPGLRPQHLKAVEAARELGQAEMSGASVGSRELVFRPGHYSPRDLSIDI